jgi:O-succinylbenzoic acid--CoA ligase
VATTDPTPGSNPATDLSPDISPDISTIALPLPRQARDRPAHPALVTPTRTLTYGELAAAADRTARRLAALGVAAGDRIVVCSRSAAAVASLLHGASRLQAMLVPLNARLTAAELAWPVQETSPGVVVWDADLADRVPPVPAGTSLVATGQGGDRALQLARAGGRPAAVPGLDQLAEKDVALAERVDPSLPATVIYTSGTSGHARGAVLTHGNHLWAALASALRLGASPEDRWLAPLPLWHVGGVAVLLRSALCGSTALMPRRFDARDVARSLVAEHVTMASLVPTMLVRLLDAWGNGPPPPLLRAVLLGGAPAGPDLLARAAGLGWPVAPTYGLTEGTSQVATAFPSTTEGAEALPVLPFVNVRIQEEDGSQAPSGAEGEIAVAGPTVMAGYWPLDTWCHPPGAWFATGDRGRLDQAGQLHVLGRVRDTLITGGENVHPVEVEAVLDAHPAVLESCVVGVPHPEWGQRLVAALVLRELPAGKAGARLEADILAFARSHLAGYKVPRDFVWLDHELPRNTGGKLLRAEVLAEVLART